MKKMVSLCLATLVALLLTLTPAQAGGNGGFDQAAANLTVFDRLAKGLANFEAPDFKGIDATRVDTALDGLFMTVGHGFQQDVLDRIQVRINSLRNDARVVLSANGNVIRVSTRDGKTVRWLRIHPTKVRVGNMRIELTEKPPTSTAKAVGVVK